MRLARPGRLLNRLMYKWNLNSDAIEEVVTMIRNGHIADDIAKDSGLPSMEIYTIIKAMGRL
jgi:hypothetical protein